MGVGGGWGRAPGPELEVSRSPLTLGRVSATRVAHRGSALCRATVALHPPATGDNAPAVPNPRAGRGRAGLRRKRGSKGHLHYCVILIGSLEGVA